jgi:hypothetical protein
MRGNMRNQHSHIVANEYDIESIDQEPIYVQKKAD